MPLRLTKSRRKGGNLVDFCCRNALTKVIMENSGGCIEEELELDNHVDFVRKVLSLYDNNETKLDQLSLLSSEVFSKRSFKDQRVIPELYIEECIEEIFKFMVRGDDGYGGFYSAVVHGYKPAPPGMFKDMTSFRHTVSSFPENPKNGSILKTLKDVGGSTGISKERIEMISEALRLHCFHFILPHEHEQLVDALKSKKRKGKYVVVLLELLQAIDDAMKSWATVEEEPDKAKEVFFYKLRPEFNFEEKSDKKRGESDINVSFNGSNENDPNLRNVTLAESNPKKVGTQPKTVVAQKNVAFNDASIVLTNQNENKRKYVDTPVKGMCHHTFWNDLYLSCH